MISSFQSFLYSSTLVELLLTTAPTSLMLNIESKRQAMLSGALRDCLFSSTMVNYVAKRLAYCALILSILLYGSKSWCLTEALFRQLQNFHARYVRAMPVSRKGTTVSTGFQQLKSLDVLVYQVLTRSLLAAKYDGRVMSRVWILVACHDGRCRHGCVLNDLAAPHDSPMIEH